MIRIISAKPNEIEISKKAVEEYLGYYGIKADEGINGLIEESRNEFSQHVDYRACICKTDVSLDNNCVCLDFMKTESKSLCGNLKNCESAYVFAATTGAAVQRFISKSSLISPLKGVVADCIGSAAIEAFCDFINRSLGDTDYLRPRFSPGYGDMPLETQKEITEFLQTKSKLALGLTESLMMSPSKSVTAIIGISKEKNKCTGPGCMICNRQNCPYS
jgi:hypothetical protein